MRSRITRLRAIDLKKPETRVEIFRHYVENRGVWPNLKDIEIEKGTIVFSNISIAYIIGQNSMRMDTKEYFAALKKHLTDLVQEDKVPIISKTLCNKIRYREKYMSAHSDSAPVVMWPSEKDLKRPRFIVEAQYSLDEIVKRILNEEPDVPF